MGWDNHHVHSWIIHTDVKIMVEAEIEGRDDAVAELPFCAWICRCGAWRWKLSPEALLQEDSTFI
jgi:hypothetical protein